MLATMKSLRSLLLLPALLLAGISLFAQAPKPARTPFIWENANLYFLLTDRFYNGDRSNDLNFNRTVKTGKLRGFLGGDIQGITQKIAEGYFDKLGVTAIWLTPIVEQIHDQVDEGYGKNYGFHGYWAKDWTALDPNFGTEKDFADFVETAHLHGIRVVLDVVINHTGPVTPMDPVWPADWVRTSPKCVYKNQETTVKCTLVDNLPDIKTESNSPVELPPFLLDKWRREGRLDRELAELDAFFKRTGHPRAPRFYIIKWLTDFVRKYGVDGYRCDTAKHTEETVWAELRAEADIAFAEWKKAHPDKVLDNNAFYMTGEVSGFNIAGGRLYDFGDNKVDFFAQGFNSLINFGLKNDAKAPTYEALFSQYNTQLQGPLKSVGVLNYLDSHDDAYPFDGERKKPFESANKLLLCPGAAQVYYGDETARPLTDPEATGDAVLRSFMNWKELAQNKSRNGYRTRDVLKHWQKLGQFRKAHPAVGAGVHSMVSEQPYYFKRAYQSGAYQDIVMVGLDLAPGKKVVPVGTAFPEGAKLKDYYSGKTVTVKGGKVEFNSPFWYVLLGR